MTTIERLFARRHESVGALPSPHGSPVSVEESETGSAGWYSDPSKRRDLRYFDGKQWTDQRTRILPIEPVRRTVPTAPVRP
jgi:hypothetical protein